MPMDNSLNNIPEILAAQGLRCRVDGPIYESG